MRGSHWLAVRTGTIEWGGDLSVFSHHVGEHLEVGVGYVRAHADCIVGVVGT